MNVSIVFTIKISHNICFDGCDNAPVLDSKTSFLSKRNDNMANKKLLHGCREMFFNGLRHSILKDKHDWLGVCLGVKMAL